MSGARPRLRELLGEVAPLIAVPFADTTSDGDLQAAQAQGLDIAEIRIDRFEATDEASVAAQVARFADLATIATIRSSAEGGSWSGTEAQRLARYRQVAPLVDAVDVELMSQEIVHEVIASAAAADAVAVVSHHDFETTPPLARLREIVAEARAVGADIVKIATHASQQEDLQTLAALTIEEAPQKVIVVAMGPFGPAARVLLPCLGSRVTYAAGPAVMVPGQMAFAETYTSLRRFSPDFALQHAVRFAGGEAR